MKTFNLCVSVNCITLVTMEKLLQTKISFLNILIAVCSVLLSLAYTLSLNNKKCFVRRLNCQQRDQCCCDPPSVEIVVNNSVSTDRAFVLCSWICSNDSQCLAFNFKNVSKTCQFFYSKKLSCFKVEDYCMHLYVESWSAIYYLVSVYSTILIV